MATSLWFYHAPVDVDVSWTVVSLQVWFKNRRAKCRQQQKAAEQVSKTTAQVHQQQQRPDSAGSVSNTSATGAVHLPVGAAADSDSDAVTPVATASVDDVSDDRLLYRHQGGGLLVASSARPSCGWVPASLPPLIRQSSDTFAGPYRVGSRLHSSPGCYTSAAAAMFASRSGGYAGLPYGSGSELGGYAGGGWNVSVTQEAYCHRAGAGGETCTQFPEAVGSTSMSTAVPLFVASPYDHGHHHHHIQHYHQQHQHQQQLQDDDLDDDNGEFEAESSRRITLQSADENKDWIKYQPL